MSTRNKKRVLHLITGLYAGGTEQILASILPCLQESADHYDVVAGRFKEAGSDNKIEQALYTDITTYLPDDLLVKVDIASMAVSLESRSPFLDHEFMELTSQIPVNLKLKGLNNKKYILKKALEKHIPKEILYRPKRGFSLPVDEWFRSSHKKYVEDILINSDARIHKFIRKDFIKELFKEHTTTKINHGYRLWALLTLELWFWEFFE